MTKGLGIQLRCWHACPLCTKSGSAQNCPWWHFYHPTAWEADARGADIQKFPQPHSDFRIMLDCMSLDSKSSQTNPSKSKYQSINEKCGIFIMSYSILNICQDSIFQKFIYLCVCYPYRGQRITCRSWFSPTMWGLEDWTQVCKTWWQAHLSTKWSYWHEI